MRAQDRPLEALLLDVPTVAGTLADARRLNAESHYASTPGDYHIATWMRDQLAADGFDATLEPFTHDVPFSQKLGLEILTGGKKNISLPLDEQPIARDPDGTRRDAGPPFNAFSGNGVVVANVIDAGHGTDADYAALAKRGLDVRTRILLIRYGAQFRGELARRAQQRGARGVLFFSDPAGRDGSMHGPAYPDGPYRPLGSVQRGSLGEPQLTIPTLPITAINAARIIAGMKDGITVKPMRLTVKMKVKHNATLWNTVGILPGKDPTHMVVIGAHRDAWVYGVTDNGSGIATVLEAARALGFLYRSGWRPQFSIVVVGFDGEEVDELGSRAYVRAHEGALQNGCIAYINADEDATGQIFHASGAAALADTIDAATMAIADPAQPTRTLYERWEGQPHGVQVRGPGGGSDFEAFQYDLGIPTIDMGFGGVFGVYHSSFDDLMYAQTQADPGFVNHRTMAQLVALLAMRLASGTVPYRLSAYPPRMRAALAALTARARASDLTPIATALRRFTYVADRADQRGMNGSALITATQRLDKLFYGRNGYAAVAFPDVSAALASGRRAAISAAVGRTAHQLDALSTTITRATNR